MYAIRTALLLALAVGCGGGGGGARVDSAGGSSGPDAAVLTAPAGVWTWEPIAGTTCGNGTVSGIGINPPTGSASSDVLVYFEGGGACWDALTCFTLMSAVNLTTTYDATAFAADIGQLGSAELFARDAASPFANATFVFVPYCTGDVHAGANVMSYDDGGTTKTVNHTGATNTQAFVDAIAATLPAAANVWVTGSSAGGYGATLNFARFTAAWPSAHVELLQDSAPFVGLEANYATWQSAWALKFPAGCTTCTTSFPAVVDAVVAANPSARIGLLTYDDDATIKAFFGYPTTAGSLTPAIDSLLTNQYAHATTHAFVLTGTSHTMLGSEATITGAGGVTLSTWVDQWATGDAAWATVR